VTEFQDRLVACADCGESFVWTVKEQVFHREHGHEPPRRCHECRRVRKVWGGEAAKKGGKK
jgi:hypothetical protein